MNDKNILGIRNRTENWKTARTISKIISDKKCGKLASIIVGNHINHCKKYKNDDVLIELFWKGYRDYYYLEKEKSGIGEKEIIDKTYKICDREFGTLQDDINIHKGKLKIDIERNYIFNYKKDLFNNLRCTEIDVVLECDGYFLIGEAKDEESFGSNSNHILCHQLIRQFVMAKVVIECLGREIKIIPFIIVPDIVAAKNKGQVKLMQELGWLEEKNVLSWNMIDKIE